MLMDAAARSNHDRTPWSAHDLDAEVELQPGRPWTGMPNVTIPGSKSLTNRALLIAALAQGQSVLSGILRSDDTYWCAKALESLGVHITIDSTSATVHGIDGRWPVTQGTIYVGSAGTAARFVPPALCVAPGGPWEIDATDQMRLRPMAPLVTALTELGASIEFLGAANHLPIRLSSTGLSGGRISVPADQSSQFVSGILIAAPYARTPLVVRMSNDVVQSSYVRMTLAQMACFGVTATAADDFREIAVAQGRYVGRSMTLEPDLSTAGYFFALAAATGQTLHVEGVPQQTDQPDIELLDVLARMGCDVSRNSDGVTIRGPQRLSGGFTADMHQMSDQALTVAALAVFADAPVSVTGVAHIRGHESDRIRVICHSLAQLGIDAREHDDGFTVHPGPVRPGRIEPHDDHRVAMSLSIIGAKVPGIRIANPGCVSKTFPEFYSRLASLGVGVRVHHS
jgi:3-phosphoshikimate 1-carboxyvinyltransferase